MIAYLFGHTASGIPIPAYRFENGSSEVLIIGGVHGDEIEGIICAHGILNQFHLKLNLTLIPVLNLDGLLVKNRLNSHGVDLNRNLPTNDWDPKAFNERYPPGPFACSEPENQALVTYLNDKKPSLIISLHSFHHFMMNVNGDCEREAEAMQNINHYPIEKSIGYPTPGCLGTYAGLERDMPTITYEIGRGLTTSDILTIHVPAVLVALEKHYEKHHRTNI